MEIYPGQLVYVKVAVRNSVGMTHEAGNAEVIGASPDGKLRVRFGDTAEIFVVARQDVRRIGAMTDSENKQP